MPFFAQSRKLQVSGSVKSNNGTLTSFSCVMNVIEHRKLWSKFCNIYLDMTSKQCVILFLQVTASLGALFGLSCFEYVMTNTHLAE